MSSSKHIVQRRRVVVILRELAFGARFPALSIFDEGRRPSRVARCALNHRVERTCVADGVWSISIKDALSFDRTINSAHVRSIKFVSFLLCVFVYLYFTLSIS